MNIKVSHESPISLLRQSISYNDFDYCLVHLMEQHESYRDYFLNARKVYNREVLLDNSIFELGTAFNPAEYMDWAEKIKPNLLIIPDVLEDSKGTIESWVSFTHRYKDRLDILNTRTIGVVQGTTLEEITACYKFMGENADMIAISFDMSYFKYHGLGKTTLERMCDGRPRLIQQLIDDGVWNWNKPHHLLGCSLPQEFSHYARNNIHNIRSIDTSNPIIHGLHNVCYNSTLGLKDKIKTKLADLILAQPTEEQQEIIDYNIDCFAKIIKGDM